MVKFHTEKYKKIERTILKMTKYFEQQTSDDEETTANDKMTV